MAEFGRGERDRPRGADAGARRRSGVGRQARGDIGGDHGAARGVQCFDDPLREAGQRTRQARPEQGVDGRVGARERRDERGGNRGRTRAPWSRRRGRARDRGGSADPPGTHRDRPGSTPRRRRPRRAAAGRPPRPSPPLFPGPHTTTTRAAPVTADSVSSARADAAFSMSSSDGVPRRIASASAARIARAPSTGITGAPRSPRAVARG